ncbi:MULTISPECIES: dTDP-4-dehydrorhamnose reductase [unclassified Ruegeria]|uniref:dTDP-4-dehydrorhamnose reductase n=1 Tax=unclassified Ruegeria TaxID=2625375 RepID=UPI0014879A7B|nr:MULTISPECIES: dTDP-4-dehydrorhamnose reductase [unclassified Ruegeria]NOD77943.1 dTDP-4-dehydrorhamnose reductase [Ruegeria sp. HKCCD4332]NOD88174.1 dTDP-4-dehydrorhamnose reductase [Ruegeria sp. HKCCD4318]NOE15022.1 dTDP-4-dehydrorhamnose reductase [Ruegeria sp. HKCCD4318-2]NOG11375.1 dTDP-4-dehydrorhamnose reductase [Ruegeria sp. HKCCD4315]
MKALIFGHSGQVATELRRRADSHGIEVEALDRTKADLSNPPQCAEAIQGTDADVIINAAAYTAVDKAEEDLDLAQLVNADSPGAMARAATERGLPFLHISTDYVFEGSGTSPWTTDHPTAPLGAYGKTKLDGERQIAQAGGWHAILRTSWVFSAHGNNFVKTILRLAETRDRLTIVADQIGGPTPAADIADALLVMAKSNAGTEGGLFHFSGAPDASWADFAREITVQSGLTTQIEDIPSTDYPTPAPRPLNSRLNCDRLNAVFGIGRPEWKTGLSDVLRELNSATG